MIRKMIQVTPEQNDGVRRRAAELGISESEVIRRAIDRAFTEGERAVLWERARKVFGKYRDIEGKTDVAENHDEYLAEAYEDWRSS